MIKFSSILLEQFPTTSTKLTACSRPSLWTPKSGTFTGTTEFFQSHRDEGGEKQFPVLSKTYTLMGYYNHSISVDANIMVSESQILVNMLLSILCTIATIWPAKKPLILALSAYNSKTSSVIPIFYYWIVISMIRCNFLQSSKTFLWTPFKKRFKTRWIT